MATSPASCSLSLDAATLSAWRDRVLDTERTQHIAEHIPTCAVCRAHIAAFDRIARDLARMRELEPSDRITRGVIARILRREQPMQPHTRRVWGIIGAVISLIVVVALFAVVFRVLPGRNSTPTTSVTQTPSSTATTAPTSTPTSTPTPPPTVQFISVTQAWGSHAASATLTTTLSGGAIFADGGISPDGKTLFGVKESPPPPGTAGGADVAGTLDVASKQFTPFANVPTSSDGGVTCCSTDGTYALAEVNLQPGATCGVCHAQLWSVNLQTGAARRIDNVSTSIKGVLNEFLSQGRAVFSSPANNLSYLVDLATGAHSQIPVTQPSQLDVNVESFSWPYFAYETSSPGENLDSTLHVRDLQSGAEVAYPAWNLPNIGALVAHAIPGVMYAIDSVALNGDTVYFFASSYNQPIGGYNPETLYEADHVLTAGTKPTPISLGTLPAANSGASLQGANARVVVMEDPADPNGFAIAYDTQEHVFVQLTPANNGQGVSYTPIALSGDWLAVITPNGSSQPVQVTTYDTATLPVKTP